MNYKDLKNDDMTLGLLSAVEADSSVTQRSIASELGIALGLTNSYLKKAVDKGLVKIKHIPSHRYLYYLTPKGFSEKTRLTGEFLKASLNFYKKARNESDKIISRLELENIKYILLSDNNEFAEIFILSALKTKVKVIGLLGDAPSNIGMPVYKTFPKKLKIDALIITCLQKTDERYKYLSNFINKKIIIIPSVLKHNNEKIK